MEFKVEISEPVYQRYLQIFSGQEEPKRGRKKDEMPADWLK
jgi:hypothetical protein